MATINDIGIIKRIIEGDGYYLDDPRVFQIVKYHNAYGGISYGMTWCRDNEETKHKYERPGDYIRNPEIIWRADDERYQKSNW